ncbi:MAG: hypothetical protein V1691_03045 [Chloroflexota bacterium]
MGDIKSALEIALEKAEQIGRATEEEKLEWKYVPEGEKLASNYMKEESNLTAELGKYGEKLREYVVKGAQDTLIRQINLPRNDQDRRNNKKAMDGLKEIKKDKAAVENVFSKVRRIFDHYATQGEQQRKQTYESLKAELTARFQQAMQQQTGSSTAFNINVERQPQFQEEWRRLLSQLDLQYTKLLDEYKHELAAIV